jgi:hypothetical protein
MNVTGVETVKLSHVLGSGVGRVHGAMKELLQQ